MSGMIEGKYLGTASFDDEVDDEPLWSRAYNHGPGAFWWNADRTKLGLMIPCAGAQRGCCMSFWHIRPHQNSGGHSWEWDGNVERPTLHPSLHAVGVWHGWMRDGNLHDA